MKRDKGAYVSFGIAILIAAIMFNVALILMIQVDKEYDKKGEDLNVATINICIPTIQDISTLKEDIKSLDGVLQVETREAVFLEATAKEFRGIDHSMNTVFYNKDDYRDINKLDIKEKSTSLQTNTIYLPLYVASFGEFTLDDEIIYEIGDKSHKFLVTGILEEMQYGNYGKGVMGVYLPNSTYQKFASEYQENKVIEYSIIASDDVEINVINNEVNNLLEDKDITTVINSDKVSTKDTRMMMCNLLILFLSTFAGIVIVVSVLLCKFRIISYIDEEMVNMGVLKALGYTANMIIGSVIFPYIIVTIVASMLGSIISYTVLPILSQMLTLQAGFSFKLQFDAKSLFIVETVLVLMVGIFTYMSAMRIKKLQPINAIRGNTGEKNIKDNYVPLDQTRVNIKLALIIKQMFSNGNKNILLFTVSLVLSAMVYMASTLYYNVTFKPNNFISTLSEEIPDVIVYPKMGSEDVLVQDLDNNSNTRTTLEYMVGSTNIDNVPITVFACEDFGVVSNDLCYRGKNPNKDNEIALGSIFEKQYNIGEEIEIQNGDISHSYKITGFVQSVNYQGKICELSIQGYSKLSPEPILPSQYVYLKEGVDVEEFIDQIKQGSDQKISSVVNYKEMMQTTQEMYSGITSIIVIIIFSMAIVILVIVLYIIIKVVLIQKKQELGIYKAIGYSNLQLISQFIGSLLPASALGILVSSILGLFYIPYINNLIFEQIGAMKNNLEVSSTVLLVFGLLQVVVYILIGIFLSKPIRRISAYKLIKGD